MVKKDISRSPRFRTHLLRELVSEPDQDRFPLSSLSLSGSGQELGLPKAVEAELVSSQRDAMARGDLEQKHLRIDRGLTEETGELNKIRWRKRKTSSKRDVHIYINKYKC